VTHTVRPPASAGGLLTSMKMPRVPRVGSGAASRGLPGRRQAFPADVGHHVTVPLQATAMCRTWASFHLWARASLPRADRIQGRHEPTRRPRRGDGGARLRKVGGAGSPPFRTSPRRRNGACCTRGWLTAGLPRPTSRVGRRLGLPGWTGCASTTCATRPCGCGSPRAQTRRRPAWGRTHIGGVHARPPRPPVRRQGCRPLAQWRPRNNTEGRSRLVSSTDPVQVKRRGGRERFRTSGLCRVKAALSH
jgi:hypothetical protein